ncbi:ankyrin repeat-containing protein [Metarhizium acridum CQMa 102]|uniref:Ankyrin repeat-containing protein n=1 Tax=Metarhizium acridum (strain CQMa 102) TaxID=655827 RepID=E9EC66_METAQ|nr:ankyrin repeat-containing protein [Metarhizium acridum CQMa 102]EFY86492.1 ankyrin repeat-containing protein [Metarhizium acridum CQMa 102]
MPRAAARTSASGHGGSPYTRRTPANTRVASNSNTYSLRSKTSHATRLPNEMKHAIAGFLPQQALYQLAKCSTNWADIALPRLYDLDARSGNPKAIKWAAKNCARSDPQLALKLLARSVKYKGDVNAIYTDDGVHATALHYAAAHGAREVVKELLRLGARVDTWSSGFELARGLGISILHESLDKQFSWLEKYDGNWEWSPLVIPILKNDTETAELLVGAGAPAITVLHRDHDSFFNALPVVTVYHLLAAAEPRHAAKWTHAFGHDIYKAVMNVPMHNFSTALNTAIRNENGPVFDMLMDLGADPDVPTVWGGTALLTAVQKAFAPELTLPRRKTMMTWILRLIQAGATLNPPNPGRDSPLSCALRLYASTINAVEPCVKKVVEILVENGADINLRGSTGETVLQAYCHSMFCFQHLRYSPLETMLRYLIAKGGNVNALPGHGQPTIMSVSIRNILRAGKVTPFHAILRDAEAKIHPREVTFVFFHWITHTWFRKAYNIFQHRQTLTQDQINLAWTKAIQKNDDKLCKALQEQGLMPTHYGRLMNQVIRGRVKKFWPKILDLGFDADYIADTHLGTFLHTLVRQVQKPASTGVDTISPSQAVEIAETCIARGTSILIRDAQGKLALDLLPEGHPKLRSVLLEAYYEKTKSMFT